MSNHSITGPQVDDELNSKAKWLVVFVFFALCLLVVRLFYLQVFMGAHYDNLAQNNRLRILTVRAPRGKIVDRNGLTLADNRPAFNVVVVPEDIENRAATVRRLAELLDRAPEEIDRAIQAGSGRPYEPVAVARDVSFDAMARVEMELYSLNGVAIEATAERDYIDNELASHVLGYLGEVTQTQIEKHPERGYVQGDLVGRGGVEQAFEAELKGIKGALVVEVDARGRKIRVIKDLPATSGRELRLSLDKRLQAIALNAMGDKYGSVVAMDPRTGEVLVMVSTPGFDPNMFLTPIAPESWQQMMEDPLHPMENRAIRGQYPPGSVFKPFMCVAALETGTMTPEQEVYCSGRYYLGRHPYRCWQPRGHGRINMTSAVEQSCDVYFYTVGLAMGIDTIHDFATRFGFGSRTGIELKPESAGLVPSQAWKKRRFGKSWMRGETVITSIGQGYLLTTPLQVVSGVSALVNGGHLYQPTILAGKRPLLKRELNMSEADTRVIREAFRAVIEGPHGTSRGIRDPMFSIGGKTGTAQVARGMISKLPDASDIPYELRDHAWFVGFAPVDNPEIVVVAMVEHGGHGASIASPIVRDVIRGYYFLKGLKDEQLLQKTQ